MFVDKHWVEIQGLILHELPHPITVNNTDSTSSSHGHITHYVTFIIQYQGHSEGVDALVAILETHDLILGFDWLLCHHLEINWKNRTLQFTCYIQYCNKLQGSQLPDLRNVPISIQEIEEDLPSKIPTIYHGYILKKEIRMNTQVQAMGSCHKSQT